MALNNVKAGEGTQAPPIPENGIFAPPWTTKWTKEKGKKSLNSTQTPRSGRKNAQERQKKKNKWRGDPSDVWSGGKIWKRNRPGKGL